MREARDKEKKETQSEREINRHKLEETSCSLCPLEYLKQPSWRGLVLILVYSLTTCILLHIATRMTHYSLIQFQVCLLCGHDVGRRSLCRL